MVDDQNNDEYEFAELDDAIDSETMEEDAELRPLNKKSQVFGQEHPTQKDIKRNALILLGVVIFIMMTYKLIGYLFYSTKPQSVAKINPAPIQHAAPAPTPAPQQVIAPIPQPVQPVASQAVVSQVANPELDKKVAVIELTQERVSAEVGSVSQQLDTVNNQVSQLNGQINNLNQVITTLSAQLEKQSQELSVLVARTQPKPIAKPIHKPSYQPIIYYIQAVIPGRAWLIGTNGSTLTVREGTRIAGYGTIKLIDSIQGRVLTSSGQVIRFSQDDS